MCFGRMLRIPRYVMHNTTVKNGRGLNWLWATESSYGSEKSASAYVRVTPPGGIVGPFDLPGESLQASADW